MMKFCQSSNRMTDAATHGIHLQTNTLRQQVVSNIEWNEVKVNGGGD